MSLHPGSDPKPYSRRIPPASRLIPGISGKNPGRKKPQSVRVDGSYWVAPEPKPLSRSALAASLATSLPLPIDVANPATLICEVALDMSIVAMDFVAANEFCALLRFVLKGQTSGLLRPFSAPGFGIMLLHGIVLTLIGHTQGLNTREASPREDFRIGKVVFWSTLLIAAATRFAGDSISFVAVIAACPLNYAALLGWRSWREKARSTQKASSTRNVLIVGNGKVARELAAYCVQNPAAGRIFRGFVADNEPISEDVRGPVEDLARIA